MDLGLNTAFKVKGGLGGTSKKWKKAYSCCVLNGWECHFTDFGMYVCNGHSSQTNCLFGGISPNEN